MPGQPMSIVHKGKHVDDDNALPTKLVGSLAKEPFSGAVDKTHTFTQSMNGFAIKNDGASSLTFTIAGDTYTVKANEMFTEKFEPFTDVTITTTVAYRAYGLL